MLEMEVATIASGKRITSLKRERNARRHAGQPVMWFLLDKFGQYLVCSQKLSCVQQYVNAHAEGPWDRVHMSGLYESVHSSGGRTGGFYKNRWKLVVCPIEDAAAMLEEKRRGVERTILLAEPTSYTVG